jgi:hypothetical protein
LKQLLVSRTNPNNEWLDGDLVLRRGKWRTFNNLEDVCPSDLNGPQPFTSLNTIHTCRQPMGKAGEIKARFRIVTRFRIVASSAPVAARA